MPQLQIGTTDKRINSTKQTFTSAYTHDCKLKEPCSMDSPVFLIQGLSKGTHYNYAKFENRYYFISNIVYRTNDIQEIHCELDPLATYKSAITSTSAWVKYADASHWNQIIDDLRMQVEKQSVEAVPSKASLFNVDLTPTDGTIIMRVMEAAYDDGHQGVKTYALSFSAFKDCLCDLTGFMDGLTQGTTATLIEFAQILGKIWAAIGGQGSWRDNMLSCIYMPISFSNYSRWGSPDDGIFLGCIPTRASGVELTSPITILKNSGSLTVPWSADSQTYTFLKNPRWTSMQIQSPGGYQEVDVTDLKDQQSFGFFSALNIASGEWSCKVTEGYIDSGKVLTAFSGNIGIDMMGIVGSNASYAQAFETGAGKAIRAAFGDVSVATQIGESKSQGTITKTSTDSSGNTITTTKNFEESTPVFKSEGSGISGSFLPSGISVGGASGNIGGGISNMFLFGSGSGATNAGSIIVRTTQYKPEDLAHYTDYCDEYGYPCNKFLTLSSISGYCCCVGASVMNATGATEASKSTINSYLNSGIYIE